MEPPKIPCILCDSTDCHEYDCITAPIKAERDRLRDAITTYLEVTTSDQTNVEGVTWLAAVRGLKTVLEPHHE